jgi:hypothetical protein
MLHNPHDVADVIGSRADMGFIPELESAVPMAHGQVGLLDRSSSHPSKCRSPRRRRHGRNVLTSVVKVLSTRRSNRSRRDLRDARDRFLIRSGREIVVGEAVVVEGDGGGHDALAVAGDSVAASAWDLGDEAVAAEFDDEP